jgi:predicted metal-dependent hydrolase
MVQQLKLGDITVDVVLKDIKNVHLSVYPPTGRVRISAPLRMREDTIRVFAVSKLSWIKEQQRKLREQERETSREFLDREPLRFGQAVPAHDDRGRRACVCRAQAQQVDPPGASWHE